MNQIYFPKPGRKHEIPELLKDENLKVLYGTGFPRLNDETGEVERVGGVKYTIKDGIIYDAKRLLRDVENMVNEQKEDLVAGGND